MIFNGSRIGGHEERNGLIDSGREFATHVHEQEGHFGFVPPLADYEWMLIGQGDLSDLEPTTIEKYRDLFGSKNPGHLWLQLDQLAFLQKIGAIEVLAGDQHMITGAGLLMFGKERSITRTFPTYFLDCRIDGRTEDDKEHPSKYWVDRFTSQDGDWSGNLLDFYHRAHSSVVHELSRNLNIERGKLRDDFMRAVRDSVGEVIVNSISNADFNGRGGLSVTKTERLVEVANPGRFAVEPDLAATDGVSDPRNKAIARMFGYIGACSRTGHGLPWLSQTWSAFGLQEPAIIETPGLERVTVLLPLEMESDEPYYVETMELEDRSKSPGWESPRDVLEEPEPREDIDELISALKQAVLSNGDGAAQGDKDESRGKCKRSKKKASKKCKKSAKAKKNAKKRCKDERKSKKCKKSEKAKKCTKKCKKGKKEKLSTKSDKKPKRLKDVKKGKKKDKRSEDKRAFKKRVDKKADMKAAPKRRKDNKKAKASKRKGSPTVEQMAGYAPLFGGETRAQASPATPSADLTAVTYEIARFIAAKIVEMFEDGTLVEQIAQVLADDKGSLGSLLQGAARKTTERERSWAPASQLWAPQQPAPQRPVVQQPVQQPVAQRPPVQAPPAHYPVSQQSPAPRRDAVDRAVESIRVNHEEPSQTTSAAGYFMYEGYPMVWGDSGDPLDLHADEAAQQAAAPAPQPTPQPTPHQDPAPHQQPTHQSHQHSAPHQHPEMHDEGPPHEQHAHEIPVAPAAHKQRQSGGSGHATRRSPKTSTHKRDIMRMFRRNETIGRQAIMDKTGLGPSRVKVLLKEMVDEGLIVPEGAGRSRVYRAAPR